MVRCHEYSGYYFSGFIFVTSADSGALVTDYLTAKTENSPTWQRLFWTVLMAVLAIILLLVGGLAALQSSIIMSALPFTVVMLLMSWGLIKALHLDVTKMQAIQEARITPRAIHNPKLATTIRFDHALSS